ncbi:MAG: hypothetical protein A3K19_10930 [Lentisphaerae bacterium RIFOXYB12_FULL_65_16]|nr:MAG: hypothetical protein A3K18_18135 [Lentisphaerae bacterium RIFOXYA12_64_32]OGV87856.1 MAG: hypothetical protein A3K19_10930 [Lentisphaerae bacterium RIFOXYB12_FULL_65_16]
MATKTITLELDAYERLRRAKRSARESFSTVVRRAVWPEEPLTASALLERVTEQMRTGRGLVPDDVLDRLDAAQKRPRVSNRKW